MTSTDKIYNYSAELANTYNRIGKVQELSNFFSKCRNHTNNGKLEIRLITTAGDVAGVIDEVSMELTDKRIDAIQIQLATEEGDLNDYIRGIVHAIKMEPML